MENATHVRPPPIVLKYSVGVRARPRVFLNNFWTLINGQWPWLEKKKRKNAYILRCGHTNYVFRPDKSIRSRLSCTSRSCRNLHVLCLEKKNNFLFNFLNWTTSPLSPYKKIVISYDIDRGGFDKFLCTLAVTSQSTLVRCPVVPVFLCNIFGT